MQRPIHFKKWNTGTGWFVFSFAFIVYLLTLEPTASFWDCGEFLSCAFRLEVSHAPGAPLFMLLGRIASLVYPSHPTILINGLSALASAFTILFLFWTITWFGRKLMKEWEISNSKKLIILVAGVIGSLAYAYSDSFWFSAVEAEVYGLSSTLTALVFWCILKWEEEFDRSESADRWLILIAYIFGLSVGVHLLNLLAIPAIVFVYFFKKYPFNGITVLKSLGFSLLLLFVFLVIILKWIPHFLSISELFCVNILGLPFNTGFIAGVLIVFVIPVLTYLYFTKKKMNSYAHWSLCLLFILIGISSYGVIVIRSNDNPPIDMTNPETPFALENYLNREQYGERPLFYGYSFLSPVIGTKERHSYERNGNKYTKYPLNPSVIYDPNSLTLFPRMSENQPGFLEAYRSWTDFHGRTIVSEGKTEVLPSLGDNILFFLKYQLGYMYIRYFMWNFAGKQNDIQGRGNALYGNWKSGISFVDRLRLGNQKSVPSWLKNNRGNNSYYFIPLLLGLLGFFYQYRRDRKNFIVTLIFFVLTGIALVLYLNEVPITPRERDYVFVGSFYVFAVWIGLGVLMVYHFTRKKIGTKWAVALTPALCITAPLLLLQQNYDDHDRSKRYTVIEYARNYLESCEPNAILFTNADNDTYPLWYAQEVEGVRRDIRIVLAPYLSAKWYVDQMRKPIYNQEGIRMKLGSEKFLGGKRSYLPVYERIDSSVELASVVDFAGSDDERTHVTLQNNEEINYIPARKIYLPAPFKLKDSSSVLFQIKSDVITMDQLVLLDIISTNNWKRPVYFASEQVPESLGIENYLKLDGYAYKLTPEFHKPESHEEIGFIDTKSLYQKLMNDFYFKSLSNPHVYLDNTQVYTLGSVRLRSKFYRLAEKLIEEGNMKQAEQVLDRIMQILPLERLPNDYVLGNITQLYFRIGNFRKGKELFEKVKHLCHDNLSYFIGLKSEKKFVSEYEISLNMYLLQILGETAQKYNLTEFSEDIKVMWNSAARQLT